MAKAWPNGRPKTTRIWALYMIKNGQILTSFALLKEKCFQLQGGECFATWPADQGAWTAPLRPQPPSSLSVCDPSSIGTRRRFVWYCGFHRVEVPYSNFYSMTFSVMQMNLHRGQIMQMRYANEQHNYMQICEIIVAIKCHPAETRVTRNSTRNSTRWSLKLAGDTRRTNVNLQTNVPSECSAIDRWRSFSIHTYINLY